MAKVSMYHPSNPPPWKNLEPVWSPYIALTPNPSFPPIFGLLFLRCAERKNTPLPSWLQRSYASVGRAEMTDKSRAAQIRASYLSERLHHFFARASAGDEARGIVVFQSIVENGLLLTIANQAGEADVFTFNTASGQVVVPIEQL